MEKTDKSAEEIASTIPCQCSDCGMNESSATQMIREYAALQLSKYKAVIEKLLPYAEHEIKMSTCIGYSYEKCKSIIEEAKRLIK